MNKLSVLDVTLRDGGCVNNFDFGQDYMDSIVKAQEEAGVELIELGYIDEKNGSDWNRTQYANEDVIRNNVLKSKSPKTKYLAMIDYGKYDVYKLGQRNAQGIDGIRLAFHKKNVRDIVPIGRHIIDMGYELYLQPMITLRYSDQELINLIDLVNDEFSDASALYIVDSFGEMRPNDLNRMINLIDHNLKPSGIHAFRL